MLTTKLMYEEQNLNPFCTTDLRVSMFENQNIQAKSIDVENPIDFDASINEVSGYFEEFAQESAKKARTSKVVMVQNYKNHKPKRLHCSASMQGGQARFT
jgi:hypothetical protein